MFFSVTGVTLKALPVCLSVCCLSLFGLCLSLCSLFTMSIQKCHSALSWAASAFTHTYTKHTHKCQLLKLLLKGGCKGCPTSATNYSCYASMKHICDIILKHQFHQKLFFPKCYTSALIKQTLWVSFISRKMFVLVCFFFWLKYTYLLSLARVW